jgi:hypothetical protein
MFYSCTTVDCRFKIFYIILIISVFFLVVGFLGLIKTIKIKTNSSIVILLTGVMILILNLFSI